MSNSYQYGSVEFQGVTVTKDGDAVTDNIKLAVVARGLQPGVSDWHDPVELDDMIGVLVSGLAPGAYYVWAKVTDNPETPVLILGSLAVVKG